MDRILMSLADVRTALWSLVFVGAINAIIQLVWMSRQERLYPARRSWAKGEGL